MQSPIWLFAAALWKHWWALMSCAVFTLLGVYAAATNKRNRWIVAASIILAVVFIVVAAYKAWREIYDDYTAALAKNQKPDIRGEASNFSGYGLSSDGHYRGHFTANTEFTLELFLCNHSPVTTTMKAVEFDGSELVPPVDMELDLLGPFDLNPWIGMELRHGLGKTITVRAKQALTA